MADMQESPVNSKPEESEGKFKIDWSLQDILSLGYIYLLVVGLFGDSIFYSFLGVNILSYSNVIDVLLSPIITLIGVPLLGVMLLCIPLLFGGMLLFQRHIHLKNREKPAYQAKHNIEQLDKNFSKKGIRTGLIIATIFAIFSGFIGFGLGGGNKMKKRMESGDFEPDTLVEFIDGGQKQVKLVGHNSDYLFFLEPGKKRLTIAPIPGNVKLVKELEAEEGKDSNSEKQE